MTTITLRSTKGSPLTNTEIDNNFSNLNNDKIEVVNGATAGNIPQFDAGGQLVDSNVAVTDKADKVTAPTAGNLAALDASGNLTDAGVAASAKADKVAGATSGHVATLDANGNLLDSGSAPGPGGGFDADTVDGKHASQLLLADINGVSALRAITPTAGAVVRLRYHTTDGDGGHGVFRALTGAAPGTYTDDGGITILPTGGDGSSAWIRDYDTPVDVRWFGAVGDGVTDDTSVFTTIEAMPSVLDVYVPPGTYLTTKTNFTQFSKNYFGEGRIVTSSGYLPVKYRNISASPSKLSSQSSFLTAFDGDFSKTGSCIGLYVSGTALPSSPTGYVFVPETSVHYSYVRMESGGNASAGSDSDRTGYTSNRHIIEMRGGGDAIIHNAQVSVFTGAATSTNFLEHPAGVLYGGKLEAFAGNTILAWGETHIVDNGNQVRATGPFIRFTRDNNTTSKGEFWNGIRLSSNGTYNVDAAYQAIGKFSVGLDLSQLSGDVVAIALKKGSIIEFSASTSLDSVSGLYRYADTFDGWSAGYDATFGGVKFSTPSGGIGGFKDGYWEFSAPTESANIARVAGAGSRWLAFGQIGTAAYLTAYTTSAEATSLYLRAANASGLETTVMLLKGNGVVSIPTMPTYADDTSAGAGGLVAGDLYKDTTGNLRVKL